MRFPGTQPVLLALTVLLPVAAAAQAPHPALPPAELKARLSKSLDSLAALGQFSGVVAVAQGGQVVFQGAYGLADREARRPNDVETAFNLGSINKMFTRTAVMQLVAAGKINLDSTLAYYWPEYPNQAVARQVTIRQLLQHRSGIGGDIFAAPPGGTRADLRSNRDFLPLFVNEPLQFEPGSQQAYSNAGFVLLGLLVERLSGEDYYEYVRKHVYVPAGMTRTGSFPVDSLPPNTAIGYTTGDPEAPPTAPQRRNTEFLPGRGSAAGGGYSTAQDLLAFVQALREGRVPAGPPAGVGIAGGAPGTNAALEGDMPGGYDVVVLTNLDPPIAEEIAQMVRGWFGLTD